jgi:hypothetical protein
MITQVVNVRVKILRELGYTDLRDWCDDSLNVYIGRAGIVFIDNVRYPSKASKWCNPFKSKQYGDRCIELYEQHLDKLLEDESNLFEFLLLRGKNLGCWCAPKPCHGDVIVRKLRELDTLYSDLLSYVGQDKSRREIMRWMIDRGDERLIYAAKGVLDRSPAVISEVRPYRALMLCMLYPTMTLDEMRDEGPEAVRLLEAYFNR